MRVHLGLVGVEGTPGLWDPQTRPHCLITGETGSGKSHLLRSIIQQARAYGEIRVADGKAGADFVGLAVGDLASGPVETLELVERAADEVEARMSAIRQGGTLVTTEDPIFVIVDELAAVQLRRRGDDAKAVRDRRDAIQGALGEIALMGRAAGIHLLVGLQRPDADVIPGALRDQLGLRISLGWMSGDGYRMVFGASDLAPPADLSPGNGWLGGHVGHRDGPRLFAVTDPML